MYELWFTWSSPSDEHERLVIRGWHWIRDQTIRQGGTLISRTVTAATGWGTVQLDLTSSHLCNNLENSDVKSMIGRCVVVGEIKWRNELRCAVWVWLRRELRSLSDDDNDVTCHLLRVESHQIFNFYVIKFVFIQSTEYRIYCSILYCSYLSFIN